MKKIIFIFFITCIVLVSCGKDQKNAGDLIKADNDINNYIETTAVDTLEALTVEAIEALSAKHDALLIEDFAPYMDISPLEEKGSLWETLQFTYNGNNMYLRISASDKDLAAAPYKGTLDGAVIFQEEFLELDTPEKEYAYKGSCADIRSGNLENILNGTVTMDDYIKMSLPEGLVQSDYKYWLGSHGGVTFLRDGQVNEITINNAGIYAEEPSDGGIEIWGNGELEQNMALVKEYDSLALGEVKLKREIMQTEQGINWFVAYTDLQGSTISYCFYLNEQEYTEEEFLKATSTIQLQNYAIY